MIYYRKVLILLGVIMALQSCEKDDDFIPENKYSRTLTKSIIANLSNVSYQALLVAYKKCSRLAKAAGYLDEQKEYDEGFDWLMDARFLTVDLKKLYSCNANDKRSYNEDMVCYDIYSQAAIDAEELDSYKAKFVDPVVSNYFTGLNQELKLFKKDFDEVSKEKFAKACNF